ncbi:MAG: hypothetical protein ACKV2Q_12710 [Planctomycetaceae bacterium]
MANGERRTANGEWRMANGEWKMENGNFGVCSGFYMRLLTVLSLCFVATLRSFAFTFQNGEHHRDATNHREHFLHIALVRVGSSAICHLPSAIKNQKSKISRITGRVAR